MSQKNYETFETGRAPVKAWVKGVPVDDGARRQLENMARMPFIHSHVAAMPDVHFGMGATVGSVMATKGAIVPAAVGVDIGCGMMAMRTSLTAEELPDNLASMRRGIEETVPHGGVGRNSGYRDNIPSLVTSRWTDDGLDEGLKKIQARHPKIHNKSFVSQLGSLGGGNHFIEICLDEVGRVWVMLHSGSRGIGNAIGRYFISEAREMLMKRDGYKSVPDKNLAWFEEGEDLFDDYTYAVGWGQDYARVNREIMMDRVLMSLRRELKRAGVKRFQTEKVAVNCHHNYVQKEDHFGSKVWLTRKGAVSAREGELGIIPGSMGARSFIVRGKGNKDSFCSCSHGAGRIMSRTEAKKTFTLADHKAATQGVECRKDRSVIDETPGAYKDIDTVMAAQSDLVEIVHTLKQVVCVKG